MLTNQEASQATHALNECSIMRMWTWVCGKTRKDRKGNECIREHLVASIGDKLARDGLESRHVQRRPATTPLRKKIFYES